MNRSKWKQLRRSAEETRSYSYVATGLPMNKHDLAAAELEARGMVRSYGKQWNRLLRQLGFEVVLLRQHGTWIDARLLALLHATYSVPLLTECAGVARARLDLLSALEAAYRLGGTAGFRALLQELAKETQSNPAEAGQG